MYLCNRYELKDNDEATDSEVVFDHLVIKESTAGRFKIRGQVLLSDTHRLLRIVTHFRISFCPL